VVPDVLVLRPARPVHSLPLVPVNVPAIEPVNMAVPGSTGDVSVEKQPPSFALTVVLSVPVVAAVGPPRGGTNLSVPDSVLQVTVAFEVLTVVLAAWAGVAIAAMPATVAREATPASTRTRIFTVRFSSVE
jgi:hypothetical protein